MQHKAIRGRERGKFFTSIIVQGNPVQKSDEGWKKRQEKVQQFSFANRTDAMLRTGATRIKNGS